MHTSTPTLIKNCKHPLFYSLFLQFWNNYIQPKQTNKQKYPAYILKYLCTLKQTTCVAYRYKLKRKLKQLECYVFPFSGLKFFTEKKILLFLWLAWMQADSNDLSPHFLTICEIPIWAHKADQLYIILFSDDEVFSLLHSAYLIHLGF